MSGRLYQSSRKLLPIHVEVSRKIFLHRCVRMTSVHNARSLSKSKEDKTESLINVDMPNTQAPQKQQEVLDILKKNIVSEKDGLLVIAKPPGLSVNGSKGDSISVTGIISQLADSCNLPVLEIIKAAEKESSGSLLMATDIDKLNELRSNWQKSGANQSTERKFLAVTIGIPEPETGTICQALQSVSIRDHLLTVPVSDFSLKSIKRGIVKKATTEYRVLSKNEKLDCALLELKVDQLRHHQLQVHLVQQMIKILGDHLYSSRVRSILGMNVTASPHDITPRTQEIPLAIRKCLGLNKTWQQRLVPLHLHWYHTTIPGNHQIKCPPLPYFRWTVKQLGLELPEEVT